MSDVDDAIERAEIGDSAYVFPHSWLTAMKDARALAAEVKRLRECLRVLATSWESEENTHRQAGFYGIAEGLRVAREEVADLLDGEQR